MKDFPFFKFFTSEWISGDITLEDFSVQGLFINLCSHYWFNGGKLTVLYLNKRIPNSTGKEFARLVESGIIKLDGEFVKIKFLDKQLIERGLLSARNAKNGSKGGRPKTETITEKEPKVKPKNNQEKTQTITQEEPKRKGRREDTSNEVREVSERITILNGDSSLAPLGAQSESVEDFWNTFATAKNIKWDNDQMAEIIKTTKETFHEIKSQGDAVFDMLRNPTEKVLKMLKDDPIETLFLIEAEGTKFHEEWLRFQKDSNTEN